MKATFIAAVAILAGAAVGALAAERTIHQQNKQFSEKEVTIKKGDTLIFTNNDSVSHNVLSTTPGNEFNIGAQRPGVTTPVIFKTAGTVNVICAIHPRMKMIVKVTD